MKELPKIYEPQQVEGRIYQMWMDHDCFKAEPDPDKKPFSIVMPPPNVTGQLHMGHAMDSTLQDILTRFKRMQGYSALWLPGTDHAGIATQIKVEEELRTKEGLTRYDLGREKFLQRVWQWKEKYGNRIVEQQKKMGASCDWSRSRFTMDEGCSKAVRETFCELYDKGLIYKGSRIINWCPHCLTALSDAEVEYVDKPGHLWYIRYPLSDGSGDIVVATTRPETMMGDTGVAVNPEDEKFKHLIGKTCILPIMNREIPIVGDEYCEIGFGTGAVKMTPAHDPNDFEVGLRHNLEVIRVIADDGTINENGGPYNGMDRYECRKAIVKDLEEQGYLIKTEPYSHNVGTCYRCHNDVEPLISAQWFVKMEPLAKEAIRVVQDGTIKFVPERFTKTYINWMENVHDWCISRQLWWGHQIPAWYCDECGHINVKREDPTECEKCGCKHLTREEDVLDTWFSSALWPFSTMGWPDLDSPDLKYWYPTSVMVTGYDIIFFWVARMIFSGLEQMKDIPFPTVFIHGLVRDDKGRKMSKSLGNGIDPLEMADTYGADALRFNLITGNSPGNDMRFYVERCEAMRNFANKIWNASRFVMMNLTIGDCALPEKLELPAPPRRIEAYDISNTGASDIVAAMTVFEEGKPRKGAYRYFKLRDLDGPDDYASMDQVITRRFRHEKEGDEDFARRPDLLLIDGGATHAEVARKALRQYGLEIPIFGMVKDDRHRTRALTTAEGHEIDLHADPAVFALIGQIQEETHRFAITYHHESHTRSSVASALDGIPNIGEVRKRKLLARFKSVKAIREAELPALQSELGRAAGRAVYDHFHPKEETP